MVILFIFEFIFKISFMFAQWLCLSMFVLMFLISAANIFIWFACRNDGEKLKNETRQDIKRSFAAILKILCAFGFIYILAEFGLYLCNI